MSLYLKLKSIQKVKNFGGISKRYRLFLLRIIIEKGIAPTTSTEIILYWSTIETTVALTNSKDVFLCMTHPLYSTKSLENEM